MDAESTVRIVNRSGLHARPCHALVTRALLYKSDLRVACGSREVNGKSILELMTLSAPCSAELHLKARGEDARALIQDLAALVASGFAEE